VEENAKVEEKNETVKVCIKEIEIKGPTSGEEGPDLLTLILLSNDTNLNGILDSAQIEELIFKEDSSIDGDVTHGVRVKKLDESKYNLTYMTSYFRGYPVDTVKEDGADFMETAQVLIRSKQGTQWTIKTCQ
jgi:hypothetical protein